MWGTFLSEPLSIVGLVGRYPANCLMERMPIYQRWIFNKYSHAGPLFYGVLIRLSPGYPPLIGKLHTRYSPVRRSPSICIATNHAAPRLACVKPVASVHPEPGSNSSLLILFIPFAQNLYLFIVVLTVCQYSYYVSCTTCWYVMLSKNLRYRFDCGCKGKNFFLTNKLFKENFESFCWYVMLSKNSFRFLLANVGAKIITFIFNFQILSELFSKVFCFII